MFYPYFRQCPPKTLRYAIKPGDYLYKLALQFNTTVASIIAANPGINPINLIIGQQVCIPEQKNYPSCTQGFYHVINSGETIYSIARSNDILLADLLNANPGIDPNRLLAGQVLCIPRTTPISVCPGGLSTVIVRPGDTLYRIAVRFNTTVEEMLLVNPNINPNLLLVGQLICISAPYIFYFNQPYNILLRYPKNWKLVSDTRYEGSTGFFQISAINSEGTLEDVCRNEAFHTLQPYGSNPSISRINIEGRDACLILPSSDQPAEMKGQAASIAKYVVPIVISGQSYNYFVLWANKNYIRQITASLGFTGPNTTI